MAQTFMGDAPSVSADVAFQQSFGNAVKNGEVYYNPWVKVDKRTEIGKSLMADKITKAPSIATTTGGAGTAGYALIPVYVDPEIVDRTRFLTPLVELIPRRATRGTTYDYNAITAKGGASWKLEDASLADDIDTYDRVSVNIKYGYSTGRVTGPSIAGMAGYQDALSLDLGVKTVALKELEEDTIVNGDVTTYATEYDGLINSITTNTTDKSSTAVTLTNIRSEFATTFNAKGMTNLCVTDAATHNYIKGLLMDFQRVVEVPKEELPFGIPGSFVFDGVPFIKSQFMPTTANSKRILFLDTRYIFMAVLQDVTYEELAKTNDSNKYMLKVYEALVVTFEAAMSQIYGIA